MNFVERMGRGGPLRFSLGHVILTVSMCLFSGLVQADTWTKIADQGEAFTVNGTQTVRFGTDGAWVQKEVTKRGKCTKRFFGSDPARRASKRCEVLEVTLPKTGFNNSNDPQAFKQWNLEAINLQAARNLLANNTSKIRVAVIDSGYFAHPDIRWANDTDAAGRRLRQSGQRVPSPLSSGISSAPHGLHVAGIVAGVSNNGIGIAGVCDQCEIIPMHIPAGDVSVAAGYPQVKVANAIRASVRLGARVINMSFAGLGQCSQSPEIQDAVTAAIKAGVVLVASAGNHNGGGYQFDPGLPADYTQKDVQEMSPAGCPGVISVGATDQFGQMAPYSNRGATVMAPGGGSEFPDGAYGEAIDCAEAMPQRSRVGIVSAWWSGPNGGSACYRHLSGTSMSAPHVSGVVGLMLVANPGLSPQQVKNILVAQAQAVPGCSSSSCGAGLVNAGNAVAAALQTAPAPLAADEWRPATYKGVCKYAVSLKNDCKFDTFAELPDGSLSVTAYGFMWNFSSIGLLQGPPVLLTSIPAYTRAGGPCSDVSSPVEEYGACVMNSRTVLDYPGFGYVDSITANGSYWNFDANGNQLGESSSVSSVPRFKFLNGCTENLLHKDFHTRTLINSPEWGGLIEAVTCEDAYFTFDGAGNPFQGIPGLSGFDSSGTISQVGRYKQICAHNSREGLRCKFDTREIKANRNEVITAYGRYFEFSGETLINTYELKNPTFCIGPSNCNPFQ